MADRNRTGPDIAIDLDLPEHFNAVRGTLFKPVAQPAPDNGFDQVAAARRDAKKFDISMAAITLADLNREDRDPNKVEVDQDHRSADDGESSSSYDTSSYSESSDLVWQQENERIGDQIRFYNSQLNDIQQERENVLELQRENNRFIAALDQQHQADVSERDQLVERIKTATMNVSRTQLAEETANATLAERTGAAYPNGKPAAGQPDPVADAENKMKADVFAQQRDKIAAEYEAKGLGAEFKLIEKVHNGEKVDGEALMAAVDKVHAAGLSGNLDAKAIEKLKETDPDNPYLKTVAAAEIERQRAHEKNSLARAEYYDATSDDVQTRLQTLNGSISDYEAKRKALEEKDADYAKQLQKLNDQEKLVTTERDQAIAYQKWLNDPKTLEKVNNGTITLQDYTTNRPAFMKDGYIDDGLSCINPNTEKGQQLMANMPKTEEAKEFTRPGKDIAAPGQDLTGTFQVAANTPAATPETTAPDATPDAAPPGQQRQAPQNQAALA